MQTIEVGRMFSTKSSRRRNGAMQRIEPRMRQVVRNPQDMPAVIGTSMPGTRVSGTRAVPIGFLFEFALGSQATIVQSIAPQMNFAPTKLVIAVRRIGATAQRGTVFLQQVFVGSDNQLPIISGAGSGVPSSLYDVAVSENEISWAPVTIGQTLTLAIGTNFIPTVAAEFIIAEVSLQGLVIA
jgi:hypothetical protein